MGPMAAVQAVSSYHSTAWGAPGASPTLQRPLSQNLASEMHSVLWGSGTASLLPSLSLPRTGVARKRLHVSAARKREVASEKAPPVSTNQSRRFGLRRDPVGASHLDRSNQWHSCQALARPIISRHVAVSGVWRRASGQELQATTAGGQVEGLEEIQQKPLEMTEGAVQPPGSKSLANRVFLLAALSKGLRLLPAVAVAVLVAATLRPGPAMAAAVAGTRVATATAGAVGSGKAAGALASGSLLTSAWTGLAAGWLHTLSGPDHLAALAPLSIGRTRMESAAVGALWGCGHDVGQVLFGVMFVLLKDRLHLDVLKVWGTRVVGLTLMAIGAMGIFEAQTAPIQCAPEDEECLSQPGAVVFSADKQAFNVATFATGIVHGLQPDALLVVLPALALPSKLAGASFLVMFLLGTVLAMGSYTAFIGSCSDALHKRVPWLTHRLSLLASLVAIGVGVAILLGEYLGVAIF